MTAWPALLLIAPAVLSGCGGGADRDAAARGTAGSGRTPDAVPADPDNPREPIARAALTLTPRAAPPTSPGPRAAYTPWPGFGHDARHTGSA